jgi:ATP-dependent DNA helicase PIF1
MVKKKAKSPKIEFNEQFKLALHIMEQTAENIFVTGRAGTGKSTLLDYFRNNTQKKVVVLAPTGVAAVNVKGQTIHSFFKFKPDITPDKVKELYSKAGKQLYNELDAIVIDEVSMVRADLLDCVDIFLRKNGPVGKKPFGGIQMIFVGDLYQLPPVLKGEERKIFSSVYDSPYFFSSHAFGNIHIELVELQKIYRQHDDEFIRLLNNIRNNTVTANDLKQFNGRYFPDYEPAADSFHIYLTTTNQLAEQINGRELEKLQGNACLFRGRIEGQFGREYLPTAIDLQVKEGAQIMLLNNDAAGRWINGTIGKIEQIAQEKYGLQAIVARLSDGEVVEIYPHKWEIFRFFIEDNKLRSEIVGTFTQYPLMLAWAVTIHKAQGKTFDRVIIDTGRGTFTHGQIYVALSRCTSLEGIILKRPLLKHNIWMDYRVVNFMTAYQYKKSEQICSTDDKLRMIRKAIRNGDRLRIIYLKPSDEKSSRIIQPQEVGEMEFNGVIYTGLRAYCLERRQERHFRVDRILEMEVVEDAGN